MKFLKDGVQTVEKIINTLVCELLTPQPSCVFLQCYAAIT